MLLGLLLVAGPACALAEPGRSDVSLPMFRREIPVQIFDGQEVALGVRGEAALECYRGVRFSEVYYFSSDITLRYHENGIEVADENGEISVGLTEVRCKPRLDSSVMTFDGNAYRGYFKGLFQYDSDDILLVNMVDIEDYLKGVLPGEIGARADSEYEAVKAQAVAARTYAIWKLTDTESSRKLSPTIADQLYTGMDSELPLLDSAIVETQGDIMAYRDLPIAAYYHAVCGGHTSSIENVWPEKSPVAYLEGVDDNDYCAWARSYSWSETFPESLLMESLENYFVSRGEAHRGDFDDISDIDFIINPQSKRVETMEITASSGVFREVDDRIRWALGRPSQPGTILPSTHFRVSKEMKDGRLVGLRLDGTGNGHGAGMCQCGAIGRARAGQRYEDILKHYYRHTRLAKVY